MVDIDTENVLILNQVRLYLNPESTTQVCGEIRPLKKKEQPTMTAIKENLVLVTFMFKGMRGGMKTIQTWTWTL